MRKWESEKHKVGERQQKVSKTCNIDGSLLGIAGKCGACGWSVVQLDYEEELGSG